MSVLKALVKFTGVIGILLWVGVVIRNGVAGLGATEILFVGLAVVLAAVLIEW